MACRNRVVLLSPRPFPQENFLSTRTTTRTTIRFQVYPAWFNNYALPAHSSLYWEVEVYANQRAMVRRWRKLSIGMKEKDWDKLCPHKTEAVVCPRTVWVTPAKNSKEKPTLHPRLGYTLFHREKLNTEIICHEALHMAVEYLRRTKQSLQLEETIGEKEETLAWAVGRLSSQIAKQLYDTGVW